jgi:polyhydroxyalkanoate synthesis regulator phasin
MSQRKKIDDLLKEKGITVEEAKKLGLTDLIEECHKRETEIDKIEKDSLAKVKELERSCVDLFIGLEKLKVRADEINLRLLPKDRLFNC